MTAITDPNLTMWRGGVPGGAGYSWPRNELVSILYLYTAPNQCLCHTVLWKLLMPYGLARAYSLSTLPISFLAFCGLIFTHFLPSSLSCCESKNFCCLTKLHDLETWRLFVGSLDSPFHVSHHRPSLHFLTHHHIRHITHGLSCTL